MPVDQVDYLTSVYQWILRKSMWWKVMEPSCNVTNNTRLHIPQPMGLIYNKTCIQSFTASHSPVLVTCGITEMKKSHFEL